MIAHRLTIDDIQPCPICGQKPIYGLDDYINGRMIEDPDFWIECENPECDISIRVVGSDRHFERIVAAWNARAGKGEA